MSFEEALLLLDQVLGHDYFNDTQELVFRCSWMGLPYAEIAAESGYDEEYIKYVGSQIWRRLSQVLGEKVTKKNVQSALNRYQRQLQLNN